MKKHVILLIIFVIMLPNIMKAETTSRKMNIAFIRDGFLWTKINEKEEKITKEALKFNYAPQWSYDGEWILYQFEPKKKINPNLDFQNEIWVYHLKTKQHKRITYDGRNPKWSPIENIIAFQSGGVLNVSNLDKFYNIALGVDDYQWFPDGQAFIASSSATLQPTGWTNPKLYKITLEKDLEKISSLTENVKDFYVIPNELKKGDVSVTAITATDFRFSPDGKWISFIVSPTASWSMDSNMVSVISSDGQRFEVIDEIILHLDKPKWAPQKNLLGYIAGGGRIVLGFKNKDMKITEIPAFKSMNLTPANFAELSFTWIDDQTLMVSRVKESDWSNDPKDRPNPSLFMIKVLGQEQIQITHPPKGYGDYQPIASANKLTWIRKKEIADSKEDLWIADKNGKNANEWITNIDGYDLFEK
ncbi:TolB domain-containing protein [Neobacillus niacini]|uniref:TolB family protein n=1 Tax=Neobacillus niacini TaxID=86668 RepID=UPI003000ACF4